MRNYFFNSEGSGVIGNTPAAPGPRLLNYWTSPRTIFAFGGLLVAPLLICVVYRMIADTEQRIAEREALKIADVVSQYALAAQKSHLADGVIGDLVEVRGIEPNGQSAGRTDSHAEVYSYRWLGLNGIERESIDAFQRWAVNEINQHAQQRSAEAMDWAPVWKPGLFAGKRVLRYVRAAPSALRPADAIEVIVPLDQEAIAAAVHARATQNLVICIGAFGLCFLTVLAVRAARRQRTLAKQYEQLAKVDVLTGTPNRLALEQSMHERLRMASRANQGLGVMFIDLDDFKNINDSLGHSAGDEVLREVARRMKRSIRDIDLLARYSGDEFVLLVSNIADPKDLAVISNKLLHAVSPVIPVMNNDIFVTMSIGIAFYPSDGDDGPTLMKHADSAMYRAKENGRNGFEFFATEMNTAAFEKLQMSSNLRHALVRNEFLVHYQPKADAWTGNVVGFEALVRWAHPEYGLLLPGRFIPHAEKTGAIEPLGEWVLRAALSQIGAWRDAGKFDGTIAVNLSMRQLYNADLPLMVLRALADHNVSAHQLELEVTESMVSHNPELAAQTLRELSRMGVSIAIDDFGTGQSSLTYLMNFPISTLKIDRSFTSGIVESENARSIVRAIIALAKSLHLRVVAEGVETAEQRAFLVEEGCDELQGYLIGQPLVAWEAMRQFGTETSPASKREPCTAECCAD
ncbi:MAG: EAL domain-containing protein [Betaproteobacteria bacterium]|nr:EAL domain-containing protein [Betaproteobacteria bacterium]